MGKLTERTNPDWVIHLVCNKENCDESERFPDYLCDAHTHGLEKYGHLELQVVIRMWDEDIAELLNDFGFRISCGEKFTDGYFEDNYFPDGAPIRMERNLDYYGMEILRIIIPDSQNRFPEDPECEYPSNMQSLPTLALYLSNTQH